jgi:hypothetical protein
MSTTGLLAKYVVTAAFRDKLFIGYILLIAIALSLSIFLGSSAITEKDQFSMVFAASGLRIAGVITLTLFIVFYLRRSFETRDVEYMLSRPVTRFQFLFAHALAFSSLATVIFLATSLAIFALSYNYCQAGQIMWAVSFWIELIIVAMVALFFAVYLSSAVISTLIIFAFYVLARLIGDILGIIEKAGETLPFLVLEKIMLVVSIFIPRLDIMGQTSWLIYGVDGGVGFPFLFLQGAIFSGLIFGAAYIDLNRRQF